LRSVSVCSANCAGVALGAAVAVVVGCGAAEPATMGVEAIGAPLAEDTAGGDAVVIAGGGSGCLAIQISQAISPRTQRVMAIHAVRSIN
jgi:hypothetical protein